MANRLRNGPVSAGVASTGRIPAIAVPHAPQTTRPTAGGLLLVKQGSPPAPYFSGLTVALGDLWRSSQDRASRLTAEDWRLIGILGVALLIAFSGQVDLSKPAPVTAPDAISTATAVAGAPSAAPAGGGMVDDPTSKGRITVVTAHGLAAMRAAFGPVLLSSSCWDRHAWNPSSDHPLGKACDIYVSPAGQFATGAGLDHGNQVVAWLQQHAGPLDVSYVIWQGRIWSSEKGDRKYSSGVYDVTDATGGHFDHIHVSFRH